VLAVGACDPRFVHESDLSAREVQALSGTWEGQGSLSFMLFSGGTRLNSPCPRTYLWTLRVKAGNVEGEVVNKETPNATPARFTTFLDFDGSIHGFVRLNNQDTNILGAFQHSGFAGQSKSTECAYVLTLKPPGKS
jgi:hypothetical protein